MVVFRRRRSNKKVPSPQRLAEIEATRSLHRRISEAWPELLNVDDFCRWSVSLAISPENQPGVEHYRAAVFADDRHHLATYLVAGARVSAAVARVHGPTFHERPPLDEVTYVAHDGWVYAFRHHIAFAAAGSLGHPTEELISEISRLGVGVVP